MKPPVGPEIVALVRVELVKVPPSVRELRLEVRAEERWEVSDDDWRVTEGLVSARRISCLRAPTSRAAPAAPEGVLIVVGRRS